MNVRLTSVLIIHSVLLAALPLTGCEVAILAFAALPGDKYEVRAVVNPVGDSSVSGTIRLLVNEDRSHRMVASIRGLRPNSRYQILFKGSGLCAGLPRSFTSNMGLVPAFPLHGQFFFEQPKPFIVNNNGELDQTDILKGSQLSDVANMDAIIWYAADPDNTKWEAVGCAVIRSVKVRDGLRPNLHT